MNMNKKAVSLIIFNIKNIKAVNELNSIHVNLKIFSLLNTFTQKRNKFEYQ